MYRAYGTLLSLMFMRNGLKPVVTNCSSLGLLRKMNNNGLIRENLIHKSNVIALMFCFSRQYLNNL